MFLGIGKCNGSRFYDRCPNCDGQDDEWCVYYQCSRSDYDGKSGCGECSCYCRTNPDSNRTIFIIVQWWRRISERSDRGDCWRGRRISSSCGGRRFRLQETREEKSKCSYPRDHRKYWPRTENGEYLGYGK